MSQPKRVAFQKFLNAMRKLSTEVNDSEICKRLEILMATSKDDLPVALVNQLLQDPKNFEPKSIHEPYTQYVRHFIYMVKRNGRIPADILGNDENSIGTKPGVRSAKKTKTKQAPGNGAKSKKSSASLTKSEVSVKKTKSSKSKS